MLEIYCPDIFGADSKIKIYDLSGRLIIIFKVPEGTDKITWDFKDNSGNYCANGNYFMVIESDHEFTSEKFEIIR